ncbi:LPXTG cell wall anchor domain-containing protein, partial [Actinospica acidiphila]|nr:LPXTG cell wall anchor domain-containing protein [Actinospica acidiphila]
SGGGPGDDADGGLALTGAQGVGLLSGAAVLALGLGAAVVAYQRRRAGRDGEAAV